MAGHTVGLALGGGAVRGAAHLGVIGVLEEAGIKADVVAGTSVGAIVGAAYASGLSSAEMLALMRKIKSRDVARPVLGHKYSILDTSPLAHFIADTVSAQNIENLELPFAAVAVDVTSGQRVVFREGDVSRAVLASSALPGVFPPVEDGDALYVDGGVLDLVPVSAVRDLGADYVIAVNLVAGKRSSARPKNAQELLLATYEISQNAIEDDAENADAYIAPRVSGYNLMDFSAIDEIYALGRDAALEHVDEIVRALR